MTDARVTQVAIVPVMLGQPALRISQVAAIVPVAIVPPLRVSQVAVIVVGPFDVEACCAPERTAQTMAWLGRIARVDGMVVRLTSLDAALTFRGEVYAPADAWSLSDVEGTADASVSNVEAELVIDVGAITADDVARGLYQDALFELWVVDAEAPETCPFLARSGRIGQIELNRTGARWELRGMAQALQQSIGRVVAPACDAEFCDARCGLDAAAYTKAGTIASVVDGRHITLAGDAATFAADTLANGVIAWTSGPNAGFRSRVSAWDGTIATLLRPPPFDMASGHGFDALEGCSKRKAEDCIARFANVVNFRGFSYVPGLAEYIKYGVGA